MHSFLLLVPFLPALLATPTPQPRLGARSPDPLRIPLHHAPGAKRQHSPHLAERQDWLQGQAAGLRAKYGKHLDAKGRELLRSDQERRLNKRASTGTVALEDLGIDASYAADLSIGTPGSAFLVILDTGSSDLWVAGSDCVSASCQGITTYNSASSSSFSSTGAPFDITYGSGQAIGTIVTDDVSMGGFTVTGQTFARVNDTTAQLIQAPLSGLMGLAWKSIAQTGATPFWQALASSGSWSDAEMGFFMQRYRGLTSASQVETSGGEFVMGGLDNAKFTGSVNYVTIPAADEDYWRIPVQSISVQNASVTSITNREAAIDTGTTLIGAPTADVQAIYALINGAVAMPASSGYSGYYQYPCSTTVAVSLTFGGTSYSMSNTDFNLGPFTSDSSMCTGAIFSMATDPQSPITWIVGASFLKNVYTAFRYNPPAVGFATLSSSANSASAGTTTANTTTSGGGNSGSGGTGSSSGSGKSSGASRASDAGLISLGLALAGSVAAALL